MKNQTVKIMMIGFIALASIFANVGCSRDRSNNANVNGFGFGFGGYGFGTGGNAFRALGNETSGRLQLGLEFGIIGFNGQYSQVQAGGELHVIQGIACASGFGAGLAGGVWSVRTLQPTLMTQNGILDTLILEAQGPNGIARLSVQSGSIFPLTPKRNSCSGVPGFDELAALVRVESINGLACNATFSIETLNSPSICGGF
jgi:hypothetical protein